MCFEGETIDVPQSEVASMLQSGATCGECPIRCCPDVPVVDGKIQMCTRTGRDITVSLNACEGILRSGGSCGPCQDLEIEEFSDTEEVKILEDAVSVKKTKSKK